MSDEPKSTTSGPEWTMPDPVFRSSEGQTPKNLRALTDSDDTPNLEEYNVDEIDTLSPDDNSAVTNDENFDAPNEISANTVRAAPARLVPAKRGCAKNFMLVLGLIVFLTVAVIVAAVYILFNLRPPESGTF